VYTKDEMSFPHTRYENNLRKKGYKLIAGLDEAGKGAWAGPLVAATVILPPEFKLPGLKDSKLLSTTQRKKFYIEITKNVISWSVGIVSEKMIDRIGIVLANIHAMEKAINRLTVEPDYLLIDYIKLKNVDIPSRSLVNGDRMVASIASASIIAKVTRDHMMIEAHKYHPKFDFHMHKGYGTDRHHKMILKHGICDLHRRSFSPIKELS